MTAIMMGDPRHLGDGVCADLVTGLLPPAEADEAIAHARSCGACGARLREHVAAREGARAYAAEHFATARLTLLPRAALPGARGRRRAWGIAAAAALVLAVLTPSMLRRAAPPDASFPWLQTPGTGVLVREGEAVDPRLAEGFAAYARRDLAAARLSLEAARASGAAEQARRLYLANTLLALGEARQAIEVLRGVDFASVPEPWRTDGVRSLERALRRAGLVESADSLRRALHDREPGVPVTP